jgi:hypothetical protein
MTVEPGANGEPKKEPGISEKVFSQDEVNGIIQARVSRLEDAWSKKVESMASDKLNTWREENGLTDEVIGKISGLDEKDRKIKEQEKELAAVANRAKSLEEKTTKYLSELRGVKVRNAIYSAAQGKARDLDVVAQLLQDRIGFDEETLEPVVYDSDGKTKSKKTIEDTVTELLSTKDFLAAPTGGPGSGSYVKRAGGASQGGSDFKQKDARLAHLQNLFKE